MRSAARADRRALAWLAGRLYRSRTAERPPAAGPERLLLVRVDERVGNLLGLQSLIDGLRGRWPAIDLGLLASARAGQVTAGLDGLDRVHPIDKRWFFRHPGRWRAAIRAVRAHGYQVAIDASAWHAFSFTHAALTYYSGAPLRIGYAREGPTGFHDCPVAAGPTAEPELVQRFRLLGPLGILGPPPPLRTGLGLASAERQAAWLRELGVTRPRVGLWPGSRKLERRWPPPYFVQLGRRLQSSHGARLVVLWGPGEEALRDEVAGALRRGVVAAPATDLEHLAGLLRGLDLMVTNDTGPMHLAVACGVPTVALFASGEPRRWGHAVAHARNLAVAGGEPAEVDAAERACVELLGQPADGGNRSICAGRSREPARD